MIQLTYNSKKGGHDVIFGNRTSNSPYRFVGKRNKFFLPRETVKQLGGLNVVQEKIMSGQLTF